MIVEHDDRRVLAALRFIDATVRSQVTAPLRVDGDHVRVIRNRSGLYVLMGAPGFDEYTRAFRTLPPPPADPVEVTLTVHERSHRYLPRSITLELPRNANPAHAALSNSLFRAIDVPLYPAPAGDLGVGWATLRLTIQNADGDGLPFAYVRVVRDSDDELLAVGMSDHRGEALVPVAGIPVTSWSTSSTTTSPVVSTVAARVTAYFDPDAFDESAGRWPDPDALEDSFAELMHSPEETFSLASGHAEARRLSVTLPP